jgi:hypothetical protein
VRTRRLDRNGALRILLLLEVVHLFAQLMRESVAPGEVTPVPVGGGSPSLFQAGLTSTPPTLRSPLLPTRAPFPLRRVYARVVYATSASESSLRVVSSEIVLVVVSCMESVWAEVVEHRVSLVVPVPQHPAYKRRRWGRVG